MSVASAILNRLHYRNIVIGLSNLPYLFKRRAPSANLDVVQNARLAHNVIKFWNEYHSIYPAQLIDVGANNSQVAMWLAKEWPWMEVHSFEPNPATTPIGNVHHVALGDVKNIMRFKRDVSTWAEISEDGDIEVQVCRFDEYPLRIRKPCLVKIDAENFTYKALVGFGERLRDIDMVLIEVWNFPNQARIWEWMIKYGFIGAHIVDADYSTNGWLQTDVLFYRL